MLGCFISLRGRLQPFTSFKLHPPTTIISFTNKSLSRETHQHILSLPWNPLQSLRHAWYITLLFAVFLLILSEIIHSLVNIPLLTTSISSSKSKLQFPLLWSNRYGISTLLECPCAYWTIRPLTFYTFAEKLKIAKFATKSCEKIYRYPGYSLRVQTIPERRHCLHAKLQKSVS